MNNRQPRDFRRRMRVSVPIGGQWFEGTIACRVKDMLHIDLDRGDRYVMSYLMVSRA